MPRDAVFDSGTRFRGQRRNCQRGWDCVTTTDHDRGPPPFGGAEPTFLNHHAWAIRWQDRGRSSAMAQAVLDFSRIAGKSRAVGARRRNGLAMRTLAWQARWRGDFDAAESLAHRAIARLKDEGAEAAIADCLSTLAVVQCSRGRRDLARDCIEQGMDTLTHQPNVGTRIDLLAGRAMVDRYARRMESAQNTLRQAMAISVGPELARIEHSVARTLLYDGLPGEALEHGEAAITHAREHQNRVVLPYAMEVAAAALIELGQLDEAEKFLHDAEEIAFEDEDRRAECHLLYQTVLLKERRGDRHAALEQSLQGQDIAEMMGYAQRQIKFLDRTAKLQEAIGETDAALRTLKRLVKLREAQRE